MPPFCCHFNTFNNASAYVCKDATSGTKANSAADVPNEENMARVGGIIQLVSGKANVLYAYIIQGERELTTPSLYVTMCWQAQVGCFVMFTRRFLLSFNRQASRMHNGSKALCEDAVYQQAALYAVLLCCCRGLFSAWNRMVSREHSGGWALQCTAVLVARLSTPTRFHSCSASDSLSISLLHLSLLVPCLASCLASSFYFPLTAFVLFMSNLFSPHFVPCCLLYAVIFFI